MKWDDMNQYERANARMLVDGYRTVKQSNESDSQFFERAKAECVAALKKRVAQVECMQFDQMFPKVKAS